MNYNEIAKQAFINWLREQFEDADFVTVLDSDPDTVDLRDEEYDRVLDQMRNIRLISIHME